MLPDWEEKRHLEVEKNYSIHEYSFLFITARLSTRNSTPQLPPTPPQSMTYWYWWSRAMPEALGPDSSWEHIQEGDGASRHGGWSKEPQQPLWSDQFTICSSSLPWQSGERFIDGGQATASRHPSSCKALQAHQQKLLVLPSGGLFPVQALSVSGQWVEHEGAICRAKTHQYMTCFSARHAELCAENLFSAIDISPR